MPEKDFPKGRKRLQCQSSPVLTKALSDYMAAQGIETEGRAVELLLRESLTSRGYLPASKA